MRKEMKEYTVSVETAESFDIEDVIDEFEVNGFNVTKKAILCTTSTLGKMIARVGLRMWKTAISFLLPAVVIPCVSWLAN